jgi:predicted AlkP superfamily pyrophosphatase or phosphodiesterase
MKALKCLLLATALIASPAAAAPGHPVLMISIDGLRPGDILHARERGLAVPNLTAFLTQGTYAAAVHNVLPTITYPNHTTMITGVWPSVHGIGDNVVFDPLRDKMTAWNWYSSDIKVPTLWDAVHGAHGLVANLGWPVSVGSPSIDKNLPEYWRAQNADDLKLLRALDTPGLVARLEHDSGVPYAATFGLKPENDTARARYAGTLIADFKPRFTTLHLAAMDEAQHQAGIDTPDAHATLETIDTAVGDLVATARKAEPDIVIAIVSDHGFAAISHDVNIATAFVQAGLITLDAKGKVASWQAQPWSTGASSAVILADPKDQAVKAKVKALLDQLAADPANGFERVLDEKEIAAMGGGLPASFWVGYKLGWEPSNALTGPLVAPGVQKGTHGYLPTHPEMNSSFMIEGPGIAKGKALGEIDMRDIAPTLAKIMSVKLPSATGKPLF